MTVQNNGGQGGQGKEREMADEQGGNQDNTPVQSDHGGASDQEAGKNSGSEATKSPSNAGNAGFGTTASQDVSKERTEQMAHADGSARGEDDPDV